MRQYLAQACSDELLESTMKMRSFLVSGCDESIVVFVLVQQLCFVVSNNKIYEYFVRC